MKKKTRTKSGLPWGRPLKYTQEFIDREREALENWLKEENNVFLKDFATERRYCKDTLFRFKKRCNRFRRTYEQALLKQENWMWNRGFNNQAPQFVRWALSTLHEYKYDPDSIENVEDALNTLKDFVKAKNFGSKNDSSKDEEKGSDGEDD